MRLSHLHQQHQNLQAHFIDFHGWNMPLHYGSQIDEHQQVRKDAGIFDVSHMLAIDIQGRHACTLLERLLSRNIARCHLGKSLYALLLNEDAGVIDDVMIYRLSMHHFRMVVNAGNRAVCLDWLQQHAAPLTDCTVTPLPEHGLIAVQGPQAINRFKKAIPEVLYVATLAAFSCDQYRFADDDMTLARTGYTGEDGIEIIAPAHLLQELWERLVAAGMRPAGLGARDSLRLEAGLPLHGQEMDANTHVLHTYLARFVDLDSRDFVGKQALLHDQEQPLQQKQSTVGLYTRDKGIPRTGQNISWNDQIAGKVTSGAYAPDLGYSIALARIDSSMLEDIKKQPEGLLIHCHKRLLQAKLTPIPFFRKTKN